MRNHTRSILLMGTLAALGCAATQSQAAMIAQFSFEDAPGTSTVDSVNSVALDMKNGAGTLTDYHGAAGSGVKGVGVALDFSSNVGHYNSTTGTAAAAPVAIVNNSTNLGIGSVSQLSASIWIKSDGTLVTNKAPRYFVFGPNGTIDVNNPSSGANVFGLQNQNNANTAVFVNGTNYQISSGGAIAPSTWVFFAVTYDATVDNGTINLYRGDENTAPVLAGTKTGVNGGNPLNIGTSATLMLGNNNNPAATSQRGFDGWMDDFRLMTGALDLDGAQAIWAQSVPEPGSISLVATLALTGLTARRRRSA